MASRMLSASVTMKKLRSMKKPELVNLATQMGIDASGPKEHLIEALKPFVIEPQPPQVKTPSDGASQPLPVTPEEKPDKYSVSRYGNLN